MNEQELRAIVRDGVARRMGQSGVRSAESGVLGPRSGVLGPRSEVLGAGSGVRGAEAFGPSHSVYVHLANVGGECVIEPSVPCNHCNYCKSHGH